LKIQALIEGKKPQNSNTTGISNFSSYILIIAAFVMLFTENVKISRPDSSPVNILIRFEN